MMNLKKIPFRKICLLTGIGLVLSAGIMLLLWQGRILWSQRRAASIVDTLRILMPEAHGSVPEVRTDNTMPILSLDGTDFIGILEMPIHGSALPVCAEWGQLSRYPSYFGGSIYDRTMQIGGMSQKGQYDFYREISVGDELFFTDMTGNCYAYTVENIRYTQHADQSELNREEAALVLFIKNVYAFEYILVFCEVSD